jgi:hypothetical protein
VIEIRLREDANLEGLASALREQAATANNVVNDLHGHPRDQLTKYVQWSQNAEAALNNHLERRQVDELVYTRHYWTLRQILDSAPDVTGQIWSELRRRADALNDLHNEVRRLAARWLLPGRVLVLDTNVILHSTPSYEKLDWTGYLGAPAVHLVVPLLVVDQLDTLKRNGKDRVRTDARRHLKQIEEILPDPNERVNLKAPDGSTATTTLDVLMDPPDHARLTDTDSEVVRRAAYLRRMVGKQVSVVTWDTGMKFRARNARLQAIEPPKTGEITSST